MRRGPGPAAEGVVGGHIHARRVRPLRVEVVAVPLLLVGQPTSLHPFTGRWRWLSYLQCLYHDWLYDGGFIYDRAEPPWYTGNADGTVRWLCPRCLADFFPGEDL